VRTSGDRIGGNNVAGTSAANRVDRCVVLVEEAVAFQLLVEGEDGALGGSVDIASSTTASIEVVGVRGGDLGWRARERSLLETVVVTGSTSARVVEAAGGVDGRALGNDGHVEGWFLYLL
jgi:hypothetical protein